MHHVNCQSTWYSMSWLGQINPCVCVLPHKCSFGIAERSGVAGHVKFDNCTPAYYCNSKLQRSKHAHDTYKHSHEKHAETLCVKHHLHCPSPLQTNPMVLNTRLEHFHRRGTLQLRGHVGGHQGHQAAAQGVHLQRWHGSLIAPNLKCWQGISRNHPMFRLPCYSWRVGKFPYFKVLQSTKLSHWRW